MAQTTWAGIAVIRQCLKVGGRLWAVDLVGGSRVAYVTTLPQGGITHRVVPEDIDALVGAGEIAVVEGGAHSDTQDYVLV
jgi:hypothetical protein